MLRSKRIVLMVFLGLYLLLQPGYYAHAAQTILPAQWQQLTSDKAFSYKKDKEVPPPPPEYQPSAFQKFFRAVFEFFGSGIGNLILWLLVLVLVGYIVYSVFFSNSFFLGRNRKMVKDTGPPQDEGEDIARTNWEALLQKATQNNDLRLAVRYSYMWLLQMLQQQEMIRYRNDKTNYEYSLELNDTQYKQPFKQLSRQYEYAWYGQFAMSAASFNEYMALFNNVKKQLGT
jgi:hypothetical protein